MSRDIAYPVPALSPFGGGLRGRKSPVIKHDFSSWIIGIPKNFLALATNNLNTWCLGVLSKRSADPDFTSGVVKKSFPPLLVLLVPLLAAIAKHHQQL